MDEYRAPRESRHDGPAKGGRAVRVVVALGPPPLSATVGATAAALVESAANCALYVAILLHMPRLGENLKR